MSPPSPPHRRAGTRWLVLATVALAQLMVVLDATIVNIALPSAQADLGFSDDDRQWVVTAYALAFGSLLLLGGRLADLFGRTPDVPRRPGRLRASPPPSAAPRRASSCSSPPAPCRACSARCSPRPPCRCSPPRSPMPKERAKAFGVFGAIAGCGGAIGLLLGGVPHRVPLLALEPLRQRAHRRRRVRRRRVLLLPHGRSPHAPAGSTSPASLLGVGRPVRPGVRLLASAEPQGWDAPLTWALARRQRRRCWSAFVRRAAHRRAPAAAAARSSSTATAAARSWRSLVAGVRDVRGVPLPHLLPAADPRVHPDAGPARVPADGRLRSSSRRRSSRTSWSRGSGPSCWCRSA